MKKLIIPLIMLLTLNLTAQDKRFTLNATLDAPDKDTNKDKYQLGIAFGVGIEYQMTLLYFNADTFIFPGLNNSPYFHFQGTVLGFNHHSKFNEWRFHVGVIKPGLIIREGGPHAMIGSDIGIERYFDKMYVGLESGYDWKEDDKAFNSRAEGHGVWYLALKLGIVL